MPTPPRSPPRRRRWPIRLALSLSAALVAGCSSVLFSGVNAISSGEGVTIVSDQVYDSANDLRVDVYRPAGAKQAPVVVFFYGGSWKTGTRAQYRWVGETLARQGFVVMVPDYRKYPDVTMDAFMADSAKATAWARSHASGFGGDRNRLALMGHSAGAHIAALLATDGHWLRDAGMADGQICGMVGLAGPYNFLPLTTDDLIGTFGSTPQEQARSQPINFVSAATPPMLLLHGQADETVYLRNTTSMAAKLRASGVPVEVKTYPDMGHVGILLALAPRINRDKSTVLDDTVGFLRRCKVSSAVRTRPAA